MDLLRSQSLARVQGQQQQQQLNNQQFGLGGPPMGNGIGGGSGIQQQQPQSFLDPGSNPQQQSHMPPGFPSGGGLANAPSLQQSMSRSAMIQAFQANQASHGNNPNVARQLELMLAQNQQLPQNGQMNLAARMEQQRQQQQQAQHQQQLQGMNQSPAGELFPAAGMVDRRPSPAHSNGQPSQQPHPPQQPQQPQRRMTIAELNERASMLQNNINQIEAALAHHNNQRVSSPDPAFNNKIRALQNEVKVKKDYLNKMTAAMQSMGANMYANSLPFYAVLHRYNVTNCRLLLIFFGSLGVPSRKPPTNSRRTALDMVLGCHKQPIPSPLTATGTHRWFVPQTSRKGKATSSRVLPLSTPRFSRETISQAPFRRVQARPHTNSRIPLLVLLAGYLMVADSLETTCRRICPSSSTFPSTTLEAALRHHLQ